MLENVPHSVKEKKYYNAYLLYPDGVKRKISFRVRGRNNWHWHHNNHHYV